MQIGERMTCRLLVLLVLSWISTLTRGHCSSSCRAPSGVATPFSERVKAELNGRCIAACGEEVSADQLVEFGVWTSVSFTRLMGACDQFFQARECVLGCTVRPNSSNRTTCRETCSGTCNNETSSIYSCGGSKDCRETFCGRGCIAYGQFQGSTTLPSPPLELTLTPKQETGLFNINTATSNLTVPEDGISAFIIRVESAGRTYFIVQSSLNESLDLRFFSCKEITLSLAVVNRNGSSSFTPSRQVCVHGEFKMAVPSGPQNLEVSEFVEDLRNGYKGHAVMTLQWKKPNQGLSGLTGYQLWVLKIPVPAYPNACGSSTTYSISKNVTRYDVMARNPGQLPQFGPQKSRGACAYLFQLTSLPSSNSNQNIFQFSKNEIVTSPPKPEGTFKCERLVDTSTGLLTIHHNWTYTHDNLSYIREAINSYNFALNLEQLEAGKTGSIVGGVLKFDPALQFTNGTVNSSSGNIFCPNGSYTFILTSTNDSVSGEFILRDLCTKGVALNASYKTSFTFTRDPRKLWWRPLPAVQRCSYSASIERPGVIPVESIKTLEKPPLKVEAVEGSQQYRVTLGLSWGPSLTPYGADQYQVYIGDRAQGSSNIDNNVILSVGGNTTVTVKEGIFVSKGNVCILAQVRSGNGLWSEWSEPLMIPLFPGVSSKCVAAEKVEEPKSGENSFPLYGYYIIGVVGLLLLVLVVVGIVIFCVNYHRRKRLLANFKSDTMLGQDSIFGRSKGLRRGLSNRDLVRKLLPMEDEWEIPPIAIAVEKQLGEGCFGLVYKGFVRGPIPGSRTMKNSIHITVAIKYLKAKAGSSERKDFVNEIDMMKTVAKGSNPHVVSLIGCVTVEEPLCLIIDYLKYGDLLNYLHCIKEELALRKHEKITQNKEVSAPEAYQDNNYIGSGHAMENGRNQEHERKHGEEEHHSLPQPYLDLVSAVTMSEDSPYVNLGPVEPVNLISFAYQIASGMEYLSNLEIIHRDLACRNVLVGDGKALKIADFGLSRIVQEGDSYVKTTSGRLPFKWMALESINDREYTTQSDVWAFGVVLWEIATLGGFPYPSIPNEELQEYLLQGNRLEKPENCSDEVYQIMRQCWSEHPAQRPKFYDMRATFESMLMETSTYIQFSSLTDTHKPIRGPPMDTPETVPAPLAVAMSDYDRLQDSLTGNHYVTAPGSLPTPGLEITSFLTDSSNWNLLSSPPTVSPVVENQSSYLEMKPTLPTVVPSLNTDNTYVETA